MFGIASACAAPLTLLATAFVRRGWYDLLIAYFVSVFFATWLVYRTTGNDELGWGAIFVPFLIMAYVLPAMIPSYVLGKRMFK